MAVVAERFGLTEQEADDALRRPWALEGLISGKTQAKLEGNMKMRLLDQAIAAIDYCIQNHVPADMVFAEMVKFVDRVERYADEEDHVDLRSMTREERRARDAKAIRRGQELLEMMYQLHLAVRKEEGSPI